MGSWIEQAAARAVELAEEMAPVGKTTLEIEAAAHLTYLAGLVRGLEMTVYERPSVVDTWERMKARARDQIPAADNDSEFAARGIIATERGARLRAERERDELLAAVKSVRDGGPGSSARDRTRALYDVVDRIEKA